MKGIDHSYYYEGYFVYKTRDLVQESCTGIYGDGRLIKNGGYMARTVGIGVQDYGKLITDNLFYIDKTHFIKEWWESGDSVTLITRPRRFGKTLNLNMLDYFFSNKHSGRSDLFEPFFIWKEEKYRQILGTYPVISLSFANVKETTYEATKKKIYQVLVDLYIDNRFLIEEGFLNGTEAEYFHSVNMNMEEHEATLALHKLCKYLYDYYGKKVILLLDEYDTPMQEAYVHGFWKAVHFQPSKTQWYIYRNCVEQDVVLHWQCLVSKDLR